MGHMKERLRRMKERIIKSNILPIGLEEGKKRLRGKIQRDWLIIFQN